ncbi:hypothetical protein SKAU_G00162640 [Synaphobranchus kaupii]|uniref:Uncharacterized protein n=1 Tax=Synaphobranchus kaupii TaxID=118154 RepID=A0A9Q1FJ93_SYNKA|nr:hypothetical protein SKAU_G00162640 [Synaphobranchus kaupii]
MVCSGRNAPGHSECAASSALRKHVSVKGDRKRVKEKSSSRAAEMLDVCWLASHEVRMPSGQKNTHIWIYPHKQM